MDTPILCQRRRIGGHSGEDWTSTSTIWRCRVPTSSYTQAKELLTPQETQTRKATALKEIRKTLQAQQQQELQAKRRLIEFLQGGRKQRPALKPQGSDAAIRYDATDGKSVEEEEEDDVSMEKEKEDTPPPRTTTTTTKPARKRKLPRTPQQVKLAQQAHRLLKSINHEKRSEVIRQTCKRGLAKHAARQTNKKLCSDWEARIHVMKQAVKQALLRSHSQEDMACVMQQLLASASRKNFKLHLAIQMQAMVRGYLVRRKQLLLVKQ